MEAEVFFDCGIDENSFDLLRGRKSPEKTHLLGAKLFRIDESCPRIDHRNGNDGFSFKPDIGIKTGLVTGVARKHRTPARHGKITHEKHSFPSAMNGSGHFRKKFGEHWVTIVSISHRVR